MDDYPGRDLIRSCPEDGLEPSLEPGSRRDFLLTAGAAVGGALVQGCSSAPAVIHKPLEVMRRQPSAEDISGRRAITTRREPTPRELGEYVAGLYKRDAFHKKICITFDDGPLPKYTRRVLNALRDAKYRAMFFVCGRRSSRYPDIVRQIVDEGHYLGNHTWSHPNLAECSVEKIRRELDRTQDIVDTILGDHHPMTFFRPPFGSPWFGYRRSRDRLCRKISAVLRERSLFSVLWQMVTTDTIPGCTPARIHKYVRRQVRRGHGGVMVFHATNWWAPASLPKVFQMLREAEYEECSMSRMMTIKYGCGMQDLARLPTMLESEKVRLTDSELNAMPLIGEYTPVHSCDRHRT